MDNIDFEYFSKEKLLCLSISELIAILDYYENFNKRTNQCLKDGVGNWKEKSERSHRISEIRAIIDYRIKEIELPDVAGNKS